MQNKGRIYLHDIRRASLNSARHRMKRAGVHIAQTLTGDNLQNQMDWVLVDAPCTGTGTLVNTFLLHLLIDHRGEILRSSTESPNPK
jgi:16S rRNA C967 or C1407 C5-methylase (RsmB/RsmF family)